MTNFMYYSFILYFIFINGYTLSKSVSNTEQILLDLNNTIKRTQGTIKEFEELYNLTKSEVVKFKDVIKNLPGSNSYTHDRFIQLSEPANEGKIRESLYVTQLKRSTPQSKVSIDVKENVDDIVKNSSDLYSVSDEPDDDYFEDELHRMKMEEISRSRVKSVADKLRSMQKELQRLITPKESVKSHTHNMENIKHEDSVEKVVCDNSSTA